jgi:lysophospholipase L1-like esterase
MKAMSGDDAGDGMAEQTRIDTIPTDTDFLFIEAGANDFNTSTIGSITDAADSSTSASYYGAWKSCLDKAAVRVPNATIVILDCFRRENEMTVAGGAGSYMSAYRTANKEIAEFYGYPFIPFNNLNVTDSNITDYLVDYVHPRPVYVQLVGSEIVKEIEKISGYDYHKEH